MVSACATVGVAWPLLFIPCAETLGARCMREVVCDDCIRRLGIMASAWEYQEPTSIINSIIKS